MPTKLCQIVAVAGGKKTQAAKELTNAHHGWKAGVKGGTRSYRPFAEDGETIPTVTEPVQANVRDVLERIRGVLTETWDAIATQESGNQLATANVELDGVCVLSTAPVGTLMYLEKQLVDLSTFVEKLPVLPAELTWHWDSNRNYFVSDPVEQNRTRKVQKPIVMYDATKEHPAQTQLVSDDVVVGQYTTVQFSGAIPASERVEWLDRVRKLRDAVKSAREQANTLEVKQVKIAEDVLAYVFDNSKSAV